MQDEKKPKRQLIEELAAIRGELRASEEVFAAISEQALMGIVLLQDFKVVYTNRKYTEISEYSLDEILGWTYHDLVRLVYPEDRELVLEQLRKKQAGEVEGIVAAYCYRGVTRTGKVRWLEQHSQSVSYRGRSADLVTMIDITERRSAEDALRAAGELDRLKDNFVATISHELRTPLVSAKGYTELLLEREELGARQREWVTRIHSSILRLQAVIDDLLDISKLQSGSMTLSILPVDLVRALEKSTQTLKPRMKEKQIRLSTEIPPGLPMVMADSHKLQSVLLNLIDNACKFSTEGGPIAIHCEQVDGAVVVAIRDQGIGIPPGDLERIFTRFYQVDSSSTRLYGGAGIGLALVKDIIEMLGGKLWVESMVGVGSTFSFSLAAAP